MEQNWMPEALKAFLADSRFLWALCGGFGLELFLDERIRTHGDMDVCVFEGDRASVLQYMLDAGWKVYEFRGQGKVRPLGPGAQSDSGRNLMCVKDGCDIVKFYPCEEEGMLYHRFFHTGMKEFHYLEFLFSSIQGEYLVLDQRKGLTRKLSEAILSRNGIPFLAPEIALLYKASDSDTPDSQLDFERIYPRLNDGQREWFLQGMNWLYPGGHPWTGQGERL